MFYRSRLNRICWILILTLTSLAFLFSQPALADSPGVTIVAPSHEIGDLGAALGNVRNMDSTGDVVWKQPDASNRTVDYTVQSGVSGAYGQVLRGETPAGSDLASAFYADANVSLPSDNYRYLVYRSYIAPKEPGEGGFYEFTNGRILYSSRWGPDWQNDALPYRRYSKPHQMCGYGKWCVYFFDLSQADIQDPQSSNTWEWGQPQASVKAFGLWPHENWAALDGGPSGDSPNYFYLDFLYLTGDIVTSPPPDSTYTVRWNVSDPEGGTLTSVLYYQEKEELLLPSQSPACNTATLSSWTPIPGATVLTDVSPLGQRIFLPLSFKGDPGNAFGSGKIGSSNASFVWDLSDASYTAGKVYYVCVAVQDGEANTTYSVSSAPVIKTPEYTYLYPNS